MEQARGIIVRLTKLSDTSLIVTWCTESHGLVKTVAKGARRPKSAFAGKIDLFVEANLQWVESRKSELHTLTEVDVTDYREGIAKRYVNTVVAGYFCELTEFVMEPGHSEVDLYDLLRRGLGYINEKGGDLRAFRHFEKEIAKMLGVWDGLQRPEGALEKAFGSLPKGRRACWQLVRED